MNLDQAIAQSILDFVDSVVPGGGESVWLAGSRVRGHARPDSDWDVLVVTPYAQQPFEFNQTSTFLIDGGPVELATIHPCDWEHPSRYMTELRALGVRLR